MTGRWASDRGDMQAAPKGEFQLPVFHLMMACIARKKTKRARVQHSKRPGRVLLNPKGEPVAVGAMGWAGLGGWLVDGLAGCVWAVATPAVSPFYPSTPSRAAAEG